MKLYSYLALGDSYTIGEQVPVAESFPYQTVQFLRKENAEKEKMDVLFNAPEIIAKTGWTTDELMTAIGQTVFLPGYDFVSLLIGVNNQYRGRSMEEFKNEFKNLLQLAINFAGGIEKNVYVLSIPDWGITPFATALDRIKIATEIDAFNMECEQTAATFKTNFINITEEQRKDGDGAAFLAPDGLHPSGKEYEKWAVKLSQLILANLI
jgi:lysophospholipase L1-like esterase